MKKDLKILEYECSFPGKLWVVVLDKYDSPLILHNYFQFKKMTPDFDTDNEEIDEDLLMAKKVAALAVYPVASKETGELGIICIVFRISDVDHETTAHEGVHIADYYYQRGGIDSEEFTKGNESYAYLVGWCSGKIADTVLKYKKDKYASRKTKS